MIEANNAPAVPGSKRRKTGAKARAYKTGRKESRFIICNRVYKINKTFPLLKKGKVYIFSGTSSRIKPNNQVLFTDHVTQCLFYHSPLSEQVVFRLVLEIVHRALAEE